MKGAVFHSATFNNCDLKGAEIEATDFSSATFVNTDLRQAKVVSFNLKGANLENAFRGFLEYAIQSIKKRWAELGQLTRGLEHLPAFPKGNRRRYDKRVRGGPRGYFNDETRD